MDGQRGKGEREKNKKDKKEEPPPKKKPEISVMLGKLRRIRTTTILLIIHYLQYSIFMFIFVLSILYSRHFWIWVT